MNRIAKYALAALVAGGAAIGSATPSSAGIGVSIGVGPFSGSYYDYGRPCAFYRDYDYPAPARCYREYEGYYGSGVYLNSGFVFRDRNTWGRWHNRDDFHHWRDRDFRDREQDRRWHNRDHDRY